MTGPRIDPYAKYDQTDPYAKYDTTPQIPTGAPASTEEPSALRRFLNGIGNVGVEAREKEDKRFELPFLTKLADKLTGERKDASGAAGTVGGVVGSMIRDTPMYMGLGGAVGGIGEALAGKVASPTAKALLSGVVTPGATKTETVLKTIAAGIPQEVATGMIGTAVTNPDELTSGEGIAKNVGMNAIGSLLRGFNGAKAFDKTLQGNKAITVPELNGSGTQSVHPYVPDNIPTDPLSKTLTSKFQRIPDESLTEAEKEVGRHIDFDNEAAQTARKNKEYLVNTVGEKIKRDYLDFLQPVKEVSESAYDMASKFLRIGRRQQVAVTDKLYIPQADGSYVEGAKSIPSLLKAAGGTADGAQRLQMYAQARQVMMGESATSPIDGKFAERLVEDYATKHPEIVRAYDEVYQPLTTSMIDLMEGYSNLPISQNTIDQMRLKTAYAPLARSTFGNQGMGMLKGRGENVSKKNVADMYSTLADNIRTIVYNGERSKILAELVSARNADESLASHIKIVPSKVRSSSEIAKMIDGMPGDIPETMKSALAEAMYIPPKGSTQFDVKVDGQKVRVQLSDELAKSLDQMQSRGKASDDLGLKTFRKVEKGIGTSYSYFRDVFGAGPLFDALEARSNLGDQVSVLKNPFSLLQDIGKGLKANVTNDPRLEKLYAAGAGKGFHGANPSAEMNVHSTKELLELGNKKGLDLHLAHPLKYAEKLAGDLANAVSTASSLRALENGASYPEAATIYNTVLGDPYKAGAKTAAYARYVNFFNYPLQANSRILESFGKNPTSAAMQAGRAAGMLSVPTAALWFLQKDDEQLRDLRQDPSGKNYVFMRNPLDENQVLSFRKPFLYGAMFMTPIETILDKLQGEGDVDTLGKIASSVMGEVVPNVLPLTANAILPLYTGQRIDPFQGAQAIIPASRKNLLPEDQADAQASESSRMVAEATGISAGKIENVFRTFMIGPIYNAFQLADDYAFEGNTNKPKTFNGYTLVPGVKNTDVAKAGIKQVNDFYDEVGKAQQVLNSLNSASKNNQPERWMQVMSKYGDKIPQYEMISSYKRDMDAISEQINSIKLNEMYTPEQKREEIDRQVALRVLTAKQAMSLYKGIKQ